MRRVLNLILALTFVTGAIHKAATAAEDEMVVNPPYKHWSAFNVGTTVTQKEKVKFAKGTDEQEYYPGGVSEKDSTYTLLEVTPEKVVVLHTIVEYGAGSKTELAPSKITYPAMVKKSHSATSKAEIEEFKEGDEEVTVLGKPTKVHWIEITDKDGDEIFYHKMWESDSIPGGTVKGTKSVKKGNESISESTSEVVSFHKA